MLLVWVVARTRERDLSLPLEGWMHTFPGRHQSVSISHVVACPRWLVRCSLHLSGAMRNINGAYYLYLAVEVCIHCILRTEYKVQSTGQSLLPSPFRCRLGSC